jgi:hypothetical protein
LNGQFEVIAYQACGLENDCSGASTPLRPITPPFRGAGALFHLEYEPASTDPQPGQGNLHWIQMVRAGYGAIINGIPFIDNRKRTDTPYYDEPGYRFAGETFFIDRPYASGRSGANRFNYFSAQLYLVEETTPPGSDQRQVTIYDGIRWGWTNTITTSSGGSGGGGVQRVTTTQSTNQELPLSDIDSGYSSINSNDTYQIPASINNNETSPIPNSTCGWQ